MKNKPAFPIQTRQNHEVFNPSDMGLTKREYIAALCLQGLICRNELFSPDQAVSLADALLKRLETE